MTTLAALLVLAVTASPSAAHTTLDSSTPGDGATVQSLKTVTLRFASPVSNDAASLTMTSKDDEPVRLSAPKVTDDTMTAKISGAQPEPGRYVLSYSVKSLDGDAVTGDLAFTLAGSAKGKSSPASEPPSPTPTPTPTSLTPAASPTVTPVGAGSTTSGSEGGAGTLVLGLGLAVAVLGGAAYVAISRRRGHS